jgi:hypothetical protein
MNKWLLLLIPVFIYGGYMAIPRGIRNNNPGNIRLGDNWQGMKENQSDGSFVQFKEAKYGIRAMTRILDNYAKRGVVYLADIILTWAPPSENDTRAYIAHVEQLTGLYGNQRVTREHYPKLIDAIIKHENGIQPYSVATIEEGIALA